MVGENKILTAESPLSLYVLFSRDGDPQHVWQIASLMIKCEDDSHSSLATRPPAGEDLYQAGRAQTQHKCCVKGCVKFVLDACVFHVCTRGNLSSVQIGSACPSN